MLYKIIFKRRALQQNKFYWLNNPENIRKTRRHRDKNEDGFGALSPLETIKLTKQQA